MERGQHDSVYPVQRRADQVGSRTLNARHGAQRVGGEQHRRWPWRRSPVHSAAGRAPCVCRCGPERGQPRNTPSRPRSPYPSPGSAHLSPATTSCFWGSLLGSATYTCCPSQLHGPPRGFCPQSPAFLHPVHGCWGGPGNLPLHSPHHATALRHPSSPVSQAHLSCPTAPCEPCSPARAAPSTRQGLAGRCLGHRAGEASIRLEHLCIIRCYTIFGVGSDQKNGWGRGKES